jgi:hypothetical protein
VLLTQVVELAVLIMPMEQVPQVQSIQAVLAEEQMAIFPIPQENPVVTAVREL